jgi:hypothetical protein
MTASPSSGFGFGVPLFRRKSILKKFALCAALATVVLACANFTALSLYGSVTPDASVVKNPVYPAALSPVFEAPAAVSVDQASAAPPPAIISAMPGAEIPKISKIQQEMGADRGYAVIPARTIVDNPAQFVPPVPTPMATPSPTSLPAVAVIEPVVSAPVPTATVAAQTGIQYVVIISVDGMRPDAIDAAVAPRMKALRARGAFSPHAQTVLNSITLISHASMTTGMTPEKHGLTWGMPYIGWPGINGPTLFSVAHAAGFSTAMAFGKHKLRYMILPNSVDKLFGEDTHDLEVKNEAVKMIEEGMPNVLFIHFPDTDRVGHAFGWMSDNQLFAVDYTDALIGEIVDTLEAGGYLPNTLLIITADHGGQGKGHGDDSPLDRTIPWLAVGPGVPEGVILNSPINTYDTAATALYALKLPIPENWDGKPVLEIFPAE